MASVHRRGDSWIVRWREQVGVDKRGRPIRTNRQRSCPSKRSADQLRREVEEATALGRPWTPASARQVTDLRDGYALYLEHLVRLQRSASTFAAVGTSVDVAYKVMGVRPDSPAPATLLSREVLRDVFREFREVRKCAAPTATGRVRNVERWWAWMHEEELPGVPSPRKLSDLPTRTAVEAPRPTWAEADAAIRHLVDLEGGWGPASRALWISRCTGLRYSTCVALRWDAVDLERNVLYVRPNDPGAKTSRERRGWSAPIAEPLRESLLGWERVADSISGWEVTWRAELKVHNRRDWAYRLAVPAWEAAEAAGEARADVWNPPGRSRRPLHAFRACWKAGLAQTGVSYEVRQALVGGDRGADHAYVDTWSLPLREAVANVPAMQGAKVLELRRR
ncbi:MAG: hypothetical protein CMD39_07265 [Gammaproteobacteria bacterium]|nr:hypothetical protein [Gammaproteobacteria bacterium]